MIPFCDVHIFALPWLTGFESPNWLIWVIEED